MAKKQYKYISVKEYAALINKSDKTVYKMIKDGLVEARKEDKGYEVRVDNFMMSRCDKINQNLQKMSELIERFEERLDNLEKRGVKKEVVEKKLVKPLQKIVKKPVLKKVKKNSDTSSKKKKSNGTKK